MRLRSVAAVLFLALLVPKDGRAQVYEFRTPPPEVTAATASWQISSQSIVFDGLVFHPTAATRPFDGNVMMQIGLFDSVPIYADATLEPFSVIFVPVARGRMRLYERLREGDFAGTTGSETPSFPVQPVTAIRPDERAVATTGAEIVGPTGTAGAIAAPEPAPAAPVLTRPAPTRVESVPRPRATDGVWIRYEGEKWYSNGEAVTYSPDRFTQVGVYRGFPVYRDRDGDRRTIWVSVVQNGPVAPYAKR